MSAFPVVLSPRQKIELDRVVAVYPGASGYPIHSASYRVLERRGLVEGGWIGDRWLVVATLRGVRISHGVQVAAMRKANSLSRRVTRLQRLAVGVASPKTKRASKSKNFSAWGLE